MKNIVRSFLLISALLNTAPSFATTIFADSLVGQLDCSTLTRDNVFKSLKPDAFSAERQIPIPNWAANGIGQCWGLSLTQREYFYLVRFGLKNHPTTQHTIEYLLELAKSPNVRQVVPIDDNCFECGGERSPTFDAIKNAGFEHQIEAKQARRFYDPANASLIFQGRARPKREDESTIKQILAELSKGRMPLLILRAAINVQHAVLVKSATITGPNSWDLAIYDSNHPEKDNILTYKDSRFYGPSIFANLVSDIESPIGVYIRDEDQMDKIQDAVYNFYRQACDRHK